jgi:hypothetical protein
MRPGANYIKELRKDPVRAAKMDAMKERIRKELIAALAAHGIKA